MFSSPVLKHGVLALLLAVGLTMPLLGLFGLLDQGLLAFGLVLLTVAMLTVVSLRRWVLMGTLGALAALASVWLTAWGGNKMLLEIARGLVLHLSGYQAVMPLIATETAAVLAVVMALCSFGLTSRHAGALPCVMVVLLLLVLLWFQGEGTLVLWTVPALTAVVTLVACSAHGEGPVWPMLPWAAAICLVACLVIPSAGWTAEPLEKFADDLRQRIEDYLFYGNRTRTSFTLATEGYYTQGQSQMGGPANPTDHPVMMVKTPRTVYLKGVSMNRYSGRVWDNTVRGKQYVWASPLHREARNAAFGTNLLAQRFQESTVLDVGQVTVTMVAPNVSSLFVPQRVQSLTVGGDLVAYFNDSGELFVNRDLEAGDTYTVTAALCLGGDAGLETLLDACASAGRDTAYSNILSVYTALPEQYQNPLYETMQSQLMEKLQEAVGNAQTPYQTALSIQNWLRANYRYALDVDEQNVDMDFVYSFLLRPEREGYCMHFASAMTVMCRMMGVPARYVEGYLAEPDSTGTAYVTGLNAHAWTEVYLEGFGWLTFDPTPSSHSNRNQSGQGGASSGSTPQPTVEPTPEPTELPTDVPEEQLIPPPEATPTPQEQPSDSDLPTDAPDQAPEDEEAPNQPEHSAVWWWLLLVLLLLAACTGRVIYTLPEQTARRCRNDLARYLAWSQALHDALRVLKRPKQAGESPMAYLRRLAAQGFAPQQLEDVGELEALVFYGRHEPDGEDIRLVQEAYQALEKRMTGRQRIHLLTLRAAVPTKRRDFTR